MMKKLLLLSLVSFLFAAGKDKTVKINLLFTNDLHGVFGKQEATFMNPEFPPSLSGFSGFVKYHRYIREKAEKNGEGILTLDAGNFFQGHPIAVLDSGRSAISFMNGIYDAMVPAYYDFIFGEQNLKRLSNLSQFEMLASNLYENRKEAFKPYIIKEMQGVKVAILGIVGADTKFNVLKKNLGSLKINSEYESLKKWVPELKQKGADIIVILASTGVPYDREDRYKDFRDSLKRGKFNAKGPLNSLELAHYSDGADIIISGGVSRGYDTPWYDPKTHVAVLQNYGGGSEFGHVKLIVDAESKTLLDIETVDRSRINVSLMFDEFSPDETIIKKVKTVEKKALDKVYNIVKLQPYLTRVSKPFPNMGSKKSETDRWKIPALGKVNELDIVTWNLEFFPAADDETISALAEVIRKMDVDMIALQEIRHPGWLSKVVKKIPEYDFIMSQQASFMDLAIFYRKDRFKLIRQVEPFAENDYNYAGRPPLQGDFVYFDETGKKIALSVINLHMKCCGNGLNRRKKAVKALHKYISASYDAGNHNFIVLGDWNDDIKDAPGDHCFQPLMDDERFYFPTERIVNDVANSTYPHEPWTSFLDHMMLSNELLERKSDFTIETIFMDKYIGSMDEYERILSDHRPVHLGFKLR